MPEIQKADFYDFSIAKIVWHCSASEWGTQSIVNEWHEERWGDRMAPGVPACGYNAVITNGFITADHWKRRRRVNLFDGMIEVGRPWDADDDIELHEKGAHVLGFNRNTMAGCLIGNETFTRRQIIGMVKLTKLWMRIFGVKLEHVLGHCEFPGVAKPCPNLDMDVIRRLVANKTEAFELLGRLQNVKEVRYG